MRVHRLILVLGAGVVASGAALWQGPTNCPASAAQLAQRESEVVTIDVFDNHFQPKRITIPLGATVVWVNHGKRDHTITSRGGLWQDSGVLAPGDSWSITFDLPGSFTYFCRFHTKHMMSGQIVVRKNSR